MTRRHRVWRVGIPQFPYHSWRFWRGIYSALVALGGIVLVGTVWYTGSSLHRSEQVWEENQRAILREQILPILVHGYQQTVRLRVQAIEHLLQFLGNRVERVLLESQPSRPSRANFTKSRVEGTLPEARTRSGGPGGLGPGYRRLPEGLVIRAEGAEDEILIGRASVHHPETQRFVRASEALIEDFRTFRQQYPFITYFYVLTADFIRIYPRTELAGVYGPKFAPRELSLFRIGEAMDPARRRVFWTVPYPDVASHAWVITAAFPFYEGGEYRGLVAADLTLSAFSELLRNPVIEQVHAGAFIFDSSGVLVASFPASATRLVWDQSWPPERASLPAGRVSAVDEADYPFRLNSLSRRIQAIITPGRVPQVRPARLAAEDYWITYQTLEPTGWTFVLLVPVRAWSGDRWATQRIRHHLWVTSATTVALMLVYLLAVVVVNYHIERRVFQPLTAIGEALDRGQEVVPPTRALRPVERLAQAIHQYQRSIQEHIERLCQSIEENRLTLQTVQEAYVRLDAQGRIQDVNPSFESLFQRRRETLIGQPLEDLFGGDSRFFIRGRIPIWCREPEVIEKPVETHTGQFLYLLFSVSPLQVSHREAGVVLFIRDMTDLHRFEAQLTHMSTTDPLTGLMNRRLFIESLDLMIRQSWQRRRSFSVVMLNVDYFRMIVSQHGVAVADGLLRALPDAIPWPEDALVARYGDDEIAVLLPDTSLDAAHQWAERARSQVEQATFSVQDHALRITVSCSVVGFPEHGQSVSELIGHSYMAMQRAKQMGGNRVVVPKRTFPFKTRWHEWTEQPRRLLELKDQGRLVPFLQPIVYLRDAKVLGFELLARIVENQDVIPAQDFLSVLESLPPLEQVELDAYLYRRTLSRLRRYPGVYCFLNLSPAFIVLPSQFQRVCQEILQLGIDPPSVVFEISERSILRDIEGLRRMIYRAREYGFRFAVDDFGSGFSSFQYFRILPVDFLKIDGSYIVGLHRSLDNRRFLEAFIYLAHHFDVEVIAEHVQSSEDLEVLQDMGVLLGQGILLGAPLPYDQWDITRLTSSPTVR